jgi:nitrogen fixation/metabolism regulation signal transduction histidine kinase
VARLVRDGLDDMSTLQDVDRDNIVQKSQDEDLKLLLEQVIAQTYAIEEEYRNIKNSYENLIKIVDNITEVLPDALWIINNEDGSLFLNNSEAKKINGLLEKINIRKKHQEIPYNDSFYYIKTQKQKDKTTILATDITEQKRKDRLLNMGKVAAHLAHEIRNPIGSIELTASSLLKNVDTKHKPMVVDIKKSIWRVEKIIQATLLFTKGVDINIGKFTLKKLIEELDSSIGFFTHSKEIEFKLTDKDATIRADMYLIMMVLQNMISNSIDSIEELDNDNRGLVEFEYEDTDKYHIFSILDNGDKIRDIDKLFEPYKTTKVRGNGLGLALSKQIVEKHGGDIAFFMNPKKFQFTISKEI